MDASLFFLVFEFPIFEKPVILPAVRRTGKALGSQNIYKLEFLFALMAPFTFPPFHQRRQHHHRHEKGKVAEFFSAFISIFFL